MSAFCSHPSLYLVLVTFSCSLSLPPVETPLDVSQTSGVEVMTTETWQKVIIVEEKRREETSLSEFKRVQVTLYLSEREGGDEWSSLFDVSPGAVHQHLSYFIKQLIKHSYVTSLKCCSVIKLGYE